MPKTFPKIAGLSFTELQAPKGLERLDQAFLAYLNGQDACLKDKLMAYRAGQSLEPKAESYFLLDVAPHIEAYLIDQFKIDKAASALQQEIIAQDPIFAFKEHFVLREAKRALRHAEPSKIHFAELNKWLSQWLGDSDDKELAMSKWALALLEDKEKHADKIEKCIQWCVACLITDKGKQFVAGWVSFNLPEKIDYQELVPLEKVPNDQFDRLQIPPESLRLRDGFALTDQRMNERDVLGQVHYCVYCHKNDGDYCSKGFPVKRSKPELGFKVNPLNEVLTGCPLEEKISEMQTLKKGGFNIAALAMVMLDNPMCPATGHRICNDCMKSCIYQKQDPVDIPQIETRVLTDVLALPWGVEIYDLLTRWNPLRKKQFVAKAYNGKKICVMGMGPAGFTLAHHLLMEGFAVVGADGLKIEPLDKALISSPVEDFSLLQDPLDQRVMTGFGGVAEYGITVRWDKNFLKLIYLTLMRRPYFQVFGGVRFGGTLHVDDTWRLGFDHLAIAVGAGLPKELPIPKSLAPGMRQANDFLMALQLTGAAKKSSFANLQLRMPVVVIGGGLTGIDTATEAQAYYISQVEKAHLRYHVLIGQADEKSVRDNFDKASLEIFDEYLAHAELIIQERQLAEKEKRQPNFIQLIRQWGGVTVAYRRTIQESPAYRSNHEEVLKALEEGIYYAEHLQPEVVQVDQHGFCESLRCQNLKTNESITLPARSILVATGARPNVAYEFEHQGTFLKIQGNYARFEDDDNELKPITEIGNCKSKHFGPFTSYNYNERKVTFLGDTHPVFHGNVVKAIASAMRIYPAIVESLDESSAVGNDSEYAQFNEMIRDYFKTELISTARLRENVLEIKIKSKAAAHNFQPGHFYRLQNYETHSKEVDGTLLQSEGIAALGKREKNSDILSFIVVEAGISSRLLADFDVDKPIALMGPTGVRSKIPDTPETIMIVGGDLAIAYARSFGQACREKGTKIIFVGCFDDEKSIICRNELEQDAADQILWVSTSAPIKTNRSQDRSAVGELVDTIATAASDWLGQCDRIISVGDAGQIKAIQHARNGAWKEKLKPEVHFCASVYGPMQCMLKGVCAQCLVWQVDPKTGERKKAVYACSWQEQPLELIEAPNLEERLVQNRVQEILSGLWLDYLRLCEAASQ